jgi:hypothetical protein
MKGARSIFAVLLAAALSGCADYQAQQAQQRAAQLNEQSKAAAQECNNQFPAVTPQNVVAAMKCVDAAQAITLPTLGSNQDLLQTFMAQRAEQVQSGKLTVAEGKAEVHQKWSQAVSEAQRRNAIAQTAAAQQNAAAAQQRAAEAAKAAAGFQALGEGVLAATSAFASGYAAGGYPSQTQTVRLQTTCMTRSYDRLLLGR